jgi:regulator of PEP synthase PpsR (kinase-PPPase family)
MAAKRQVLNILIVSDATGATAESVLTSVLVQYKKTDFNLVRHPFTRTNAQVRKILDEAPKGKCVVVFTLVSSRLRKYLIDRCEAKKFVVLDVMGPLISTLTVLLKHTPRMKPGAYRQAEQEAFYLTDAIEYTMQHDDGLGLETINDADLIIFGMSRSGKTPTSIYLSCRKLKVANFPIILGEPFPRELMRAAGKKVGFRISMERLCQLRSERVSRMSYTDVPGYASLSHIAKEEAHCEKIFRRIPSLWTIDVTNRSVEEISDWITRNVMEGE